MGLSKLIPKDTAFRLGGVESYLILPSVEDKEARRTLKTRLLQPPEKSFPSFKCVRLNLLSNQVILSNIHLFALIEKSYDESL